MMDGKLAKMQSGRWSIGNEWEITSGDVIEVKVGENWIATRIEHNGTGYYAVVTGILLYEGMPARRREGER